MADEKEIDVKTIFASAARTATTIGTSQTNKFHKGIVFTVDMTAVTATGSIVFTLQGYDSLSTKWYTILATAAITTVTPGTYSAFPGAPATANVSANFQLPKTWRIIATAANGVSMTYSVSADLLP